MKEETKPKMEKKKSVRRKKSPKSLESVEMAKVAAAAAVDTKALDPCILAVTELVGYADFFVIASGRSTRQAQAIAENVERAMRAAGARTIGVEGDREGNWVLIDWGSVVVHVFYHPVREFYSLEKLYGDAASIDFPRE